MALRVAVRGIINNDGKLFCLKLKPYPGVIKGDYWCVPGGGIKDREPLLCALERELIEETGVKPKIGNLLYLQQFAHNSTEHIELFFHILNSKDYLSIDIDKTSHGHIEIDKFDFIDPTINHVLPDFLTNEPLDSLETQKTKIFNYL